MSFCVFHCFFSWLSLAKHYFLYLPNKIEKRFLKFMYETNLFRKELKLQGSNIAIVKCDLFFHYCNAKEISFYYFGDKKHEKTHVNSISVVGMFVRCLVDCFHRKFRVPTQIMVCDYCIAKYKKFSACDGLLMVLRAIFLAIQNIYVNSNPAVSTRRVNFWKNALASDQSKR